MAANMTDNENMRLQLEKDVTRLQGLVKHWRVWEAEYELLKDGMTELGDDASEAEIRHAADDCEGELLSKSEILALIEDRGRIRKSSQIVGLLEKRLDYVQQNVKTIEQRLHIEQEKLDQANLLGPENEDGLPLMEITEELDEDDNVISSSVVRPGDAAPELLEMLRKGGVEDIESGETTSGVKKPESTQSKTSTGPKATRKDSQPTLPGTKSSEPTKKTAQGSATPLKKKKSVTFAAEPQISHIPPAEEEPVVYRTRFVNQSTPQSQNTVRNPIIPENESTEDMILRREMLDYSMRDIGNIVAEMDVNSPDQSDVNSEEDYEDEEEPEDEFGRTTAQVITAAYRDKMLAMEKRLNARAVINMGPNFDNSKTEDKELSDDSDDAAEPPLKTEVGPRSIKAGKSPGVRFAETLDIQEAPTAATRESTASEGAARMSMPKLNPIKDEIVERPPVEASSNKSGSKKVSRFKAARKVDSDLDSGGSPNDTYSAPPIEQNLARVAKASTMGVSSSIHSDIVERSNLEDDIVREPDDLDPQLHAAEVRSAYHKLRNGLIQRENGFMSQEMEEYEDEHGRQSISRFKAARLARNKTNGKGEQTMS